MLSLAFVLLYFPYIPRSRKKWTWRLTVPTHWHNNDENQVFSRPKGHQENLQTKPSCHKPRKSHQKVNRNCLVSLLQSCQCLFTWRHPIRTAVKQRVLLRASRFATSPQGLMKINMESFRFTTVVHTSGKSAATHFSDSHKERISGNWAFSTLSF